jgi:hypothetical protein
MAIDESRTKSQLNQLIKDALNSDDLLQESKVKAQKKYKDVCPNCGTRIKEGDDEIGLLLTPPGSSPLRKAAAPEVLLTVCPVCRILFFDKLNHDLLRDMRDKN